MKVLISAVGTTDPITNQKDGPLLHIARVCKPEKIILIYSEEMLEKEDEICLALNSIEGYHPKVEKAELVIANNDVYIFDKMFEQLSSIINTYKNDEDEFIFNLSSATPQIESAFFTINRISDFNTRAIQVATPARGSNNRFQPQNLPSIETRIANNIDNQKNFDARTLIDQAENFNKALTKRTLRELIKQYDYKAAYSIFRNNQNILSNESKRKRLKTILERFIATFEKQRIIADFTKEDLSVEQQRSLTAYLIADIALERGIVTDFLIKSKTLAEFILEQYLDQKYGLITKQDNYPYLQENHPLKEDILDYIANQFKYEQEKKGQYNPEKPYNRDQYLNLNSYINIMEYLIARSELLKKNEVKDTTNLTLKELAGTGDNYLKTIHNLISTNDILKNLGNIKAINSARNKVAHGLEEIDKGTMRKLPDTKESLKSLLITLLEVNDSYFDYFEEKNKELIELLK